MLVDRYLLGIVWFRLGRWRERFSKQSLNQNISMFHTEDFIKAFTETRRHLKYVNFIIIVTITENSRDTMLVVLLNMILGRVVFSKFLDELIVPIFKITQIKQPLQYCQTDLTKLTNSSISICSIYT